MQEILIIEDDADIAESLQYNFKREGFRQSLQNRAKKKVAACSERKKSSGFDYSRFDAAGMSGMELCRRLRREPLTEKKTRLLC